MRLALKIYWRLVKAGKTIRVAARNAIDETTFYARTFYEHCNCNINKRIYDCNFPNRSLIDLFRLAGCRNAHTMCASDGSKLHIIRSHVELYGDKIQETRAFSLLTFVT